MSSRRSGTRPPENLHQPTLLIPYVVGIAFILTLIAFSQRLPGDAISLNSGWYYSWDDLSIGEVEQGLGTWHEIEFPSNPPARDGRSFVWFRRTLPEFTMQDPHLFIFSIDTSARVYIDGERIYTWNDWVGRDVPPFAGWPPHVITINENGGRELAVQVASDYRDIGLWGSIWVAPEASLYQALLLRDLPLIVMAILSMTALTIMTALANPDHRMGNGLFGVILLALALGVFSGTFSRAAISEDALVWYFIETNVYIVVLGLSGLAIRRLVTANMRWIPTLYAVVAGIVLLLSNGGPLLGLYEIHNFTQVIDVTVILGFVLVMAMVVAARPEDSGRRFLLGNFAVVAALYMVNVLVSYNALPWLDNVAALAVFQFIAGLGYVFFRQYRFVVVQLDRMSETIEEAVDARTQRLEEINQTLAREREFFAEESRRDALTGLFNRQYVVRVLTRLVEREQPVRAAFSLAMLDLDHFKRVNDSHGHQAGDRVLQSVARMLEENLRGSEVVARYGGEEFIVVLPDATLEQATRICERVRETVEQATWDEDLTLSVSIGIAEFSGQTVDSFIADADRALYSAKRAGRNRVHTA